MGKQEFIDRLRAALYGNVSDALMTDYVNYYSEYINTEIDRGKSESQVLAMLGEPRLIARTIIQTNGIREDSAGDGVKYEERYTQYSGENKRQQTTGNFRIPGWLWIFLIILIAVTVIWLFVSVLSFLAPVILPVLVVIFLVKLFRDWLN